MDIARRLWFEGGRSLPPVGGRALVSRVQGRGFCFFNIRIKCWVLCAFLHLRMRHGRNQERCKVCQLSVKRQVLQMLYIPSESESSN